MKKLESLIEDLEKANKALKEAARLSPTRIHKDAVLQRFEFTFELAWKTIQEYVKDQGLSCWSPKSCIRKGADIKIIKEPESWFDFLQARNLISHTYNEKLADKVYKEAVQFPKKASQLLKEIK